MVLSEVIKYSASGFRDFTRIASSDPIMWRDIFLANKDAVLEMLGRFSEDLTALQAAIRRGDARYLEDVFTKTRGTNRLLTPVKTRTARISAAINNHCHLGAAPNSKRPK